MNSHSRSSDMTSFDSSDSAEKNMMSLARSACVNVCECPGTLSSVSQPLMVYSEHIDRQLNNWLFDKERRKEAETKGEEGISTDIIY